MSKPRKVRDVAASATQRVRRPRSHIANEVLQLAARGFKLQRDPEVKVYRLTATAGSVTVTITGVQECGWCNDGLVFNVQHGWSRCSGCGAL